MVFSLVLSIDEDIIQIHNDENMELFCKDLIDIALEYCWSVGQSKRHYLTLEVTVSGPKSSFLLISFTNSHLVVNIGEVELGKLPSLTQLI